MWKKPLQVYLWLYILSVVAMIVYKTIADIQHKSFQPVALILPLLMFVPAIVLFCELQGKRKPIYLLIFSLLIVAVPVAGIFNFNKMSLETILRSLIFLPMIAGLVYFGYKGLAAKKA